MERLRDLTRTMGLDRLQERLGDLLVEHLPEADPPGLNEAVARGLGDQERADEVAPRRYEYGYEEPEYELEYEAPSRSLDMGWDR